MEKTDSIKNQAKSFVFISAKSEDYEYAQKVYDFLTEHGIPTFFSDKTLKVLGNADYGEEIDKAVDEAYHMIVVLSRAEYAKSKWVKAEWRLFINEKRDGRKDGNIIIMAVGSLQRSDLPLSLRHYEIIPFDPKSFDRILEYVKIPDIQESDIQESKPDTEESDAEEKIIKVKSGIFKMGLTNYRHWLLDNLFPIIVVLILILAISIPILTKLLNRQASDTKNEIKSMPQASSAPAEFSNINPPQDKSISEEIIGKDAIAMILIPAGDFRMGSNDGEINERPEHTVSLDAFYMDKHEVTNAQYKKFIYETKHKTPKYWNDSRFNAPNQPVVGVFWQDAKAYADWIDERLPTESEWEKAARGRIVGKKYVWGDEWPPPNGSGNFDDEKVFDRYVIKDYKDGYVYTAPVGQFKPNGYGLYDIVGNVWEWCADWYGKNYYTVSPIKNPIGPTIGTLRLFRGGSWANSYSRNLRISFRYEYSFSSTDYAIGFRCAKTK